MSAYNVTETRAAIEPLANLVFKTNGGGVRADYGLFIAQYLRDIGVELEVKIEEWSGGLVDSDLIMFPFSGSGHANSAESLR